MNSVFKGFIISVITILLIALTVYTPLGLGIKKLIAVSICAVSVWIAFKFNSWKPLSVFFLIHAVIGGLMISVPRLNIVNESIRNLFYHVPMWFSMVIILVVSVWHSIKYLKKSQYRDDLIASEAVFIALYLGILGLITGMIWANYTWGKPWHGDVKQVTTLVGLLMYAAYVILRGSFQDDRMRARISAIYNIFAFPTLIVLIGVLPRLVGDSLHPGNGGNPAFGDVDDLMITVFYPAIVGWTLLGVWLAEIRVRTRILIAKKNGIL